MKKKQTLKLQETWPFFVSKGKRTNNNTENKHKETTFACWPTPPYFCQPFVIFEVTLFYFCKAVFCRKHYKNSVFRRTQPLGITDSKTPLPGPFPKWHFCNQKCHFGFYPVSAKTPIFVVFGDSQGAQKKTNFPKQIVATRMRTFLVPSEHK